MKKQLVIFIGLVLLASCTSDKNHVILKEGTKTVSNCSNIDADRLLNMEILGMTCVKGCGASIKKELFATDAVCSVDFEVEEGKKFNTAKIAFDKNKITVDELVQIVSSINNKQFKIGKTSSEDYSCPSTETSCTSDTECPSRCEKEQSKIETTDAKIEIPNFLSLLSRFFTN